MIDKKQLIEELLECVQDATDADTKVTGLTMCGILMNEVLDEALSITAVVQVCENCKTPIIKGSLCYPCEVDPDLSNE